MKKNTSGATVSHVTIDTEWVKVPNTRICAKFCNPSTFLLMYLCLLSLRVVSKNLKEPVQYFGVGFVFKNQAIFCSKFIHESASFT